jgi:hypothetical protein
MIQFAHIDTDSGDADACDSDSAEPLKGVRKSTTVEPKNSKASILRARTAQLVKAIKAAKPTVEGSLPPAASDLSSLPEFARAAWSTNFLPTLYDRLGCSRDPFVIDPDMVNAVQEVVDFAYPGSGYQVRANDRLIVMVCRR